MGLIWDGAGVQYVFYLAAASALLQLAASAMVDGEIGIVKQKT